MAVEALPAYGLGSEAAQWHPIGRGNGYVVTVEGKRIYVAGSTEATSEMLALEQIDLAFLPLYPPYALSPEEAVRAASAIQSEVTYIYQYNSTRTRDDFVRLFESSLLPGILIAHDLP
jgi:L-ascorbate metabolism protein UlaG (beta-lactamase superfamily)